MRNSSHAEALPVHDDDADEPVRLVHDPEADPQLRADLALATVPLRLVVVSPPPR